MVKEGFVIATDGDMATVECCMNTKCDNCLKRTKLGACETCPHYEANSVDRVVAYNKIGAEIGDKVEYAKNKSSNFIFALISFVVPILCAVLSYFVCTNFTDDEQLKGRIAIAFFLVALVIAGVYSYKVSKKHCDHSIVSVIGTKV